MTSRGDLLLAFLGATALHAGILLHGFPDGGSGGGNTGEDRLTIQAATPEIAAMVREWDRPPETFETAALRAPDQPTDSAPPILSDTAPERVPLGAKPPAQPRPEHGPAPVASPGKPQVQDVPEAPPSMTAATPAPPVMPLATLQKVPAEEAPSLDTAPPVPDRAPRLTERPAKRPQQTSTAPATRRIAKGTGTSGKRGTTGQAVASKASDATRQAAASAWAAAIERSIARHHIYPRNTRDEGRVRVAMVILPDGQLSRVALASSSGSSALDKAALSAVRRAAPFPPAPEVLDDKFFNVGQWIVFKRR